MAEIQKEISEETRRELLAKLAEHDKGMDLILEIYQQFLLGEKPSLEKLILIQYKAKSFIDFMAESYEVLGLNEAHKELVASLHEPLNELNRMIAEIKAQVVH